MKNWTKKYYFFIIAAFLLIVSACTVSEPMSGSKGNAIEKALKDSLRSNSALKNQHKNKNELPLELQKALMPEVALPNVGKISDETPEPKFDVSVNNVSAKDFFMGLVKDTPYNITIDPQVAGSVSLDLKSVTIPQTMEAIRDNYGFEYERTSYGYKIFPRRLETRVFHVDYLDFDRIGQSQTTVGSGQITNTIQNTLTSSGVTSSQTPTSMPSGIIQTSSASKFWDLLKDNLTTIIGTKEDRAVVINPRAGTIIVRAYPNELRYVAKYLDTIQSIVHRQVIIEAKVIEVTLNANFQDGINWRMLGLRQGEIFPAGTTPTGNAPGATTKDGTAPSSSLDKYAGNIVQYFSLSASGSNGNFSSVINLLNSQGKVNVLSSPKISTINNQKAVIKVGNDEFFVTNVQSNTTSGGTANPSQQASVTLTPFFSGISLDVTPQIDENDFVTLHIHPIVSSVTTQEKSFTVYGLNQQLPLAASSTRESDSVVRAKSGQVIVIGGLMKTSIIDKNASTPGFDRLPGVGGLFKNKNLSSSKTEIVILLKPVVVEDTNTWQKQLQEAATTVKSMKGDFSYNILPDKTKH